MVFIVSRQHRPPAPEYLWLLTQASGDPEAGRKACRPVTTSLTQFTRDPKALYEQREAIARRLDPRFP